MNVALLLSAAVLLSTSRASPVPESCKSPYQYNQETDQCLALFSQKVNSHDSEALCDDNHGFTYIPINAKENAFYNQIANQQMVVLPIHINNSKWYMNDLDYEIKYVNWNFAFHPFFECAAMQPSGKWQIESCSAEHSVVCVRSRWEKVHIFTGQEITIKALPKHGAKYFFLNVRQPGSTLIRFMGNMEDKLIKINEKKNGVFGNEVVANEQSLANFGLIQEIEFTLVIKVLAGGYELRLNNEEVTVYYPSLNDPADRLLDATIRFWRDIVVNSVEEKNFFAVDVEVANGRNDQSKDAICNIAYSSHPNDPVRFTPLTGHLFERGKIHKFAAVLAPDHGAPSKIVLYCESSSADALYIKHIYVESKAGKYKGMVDKVFDDATCNLSGTAGQRGKSCVRNAEVDMEEI